MKKLILVMALLISVCSYAQNKDVQKNIGTVNFYGIDYSMVKVYGPKETVNEFKIAFEEINNLFISEPKKYDISKFLKKDISGIYLDGVKSRIDDIQEDDLFTTSTVVKGLDENAIKEVVKGISVKEKNGTGVLIIAEKLDKAKNRGYYRVVFFDVKKRNIIDNFGIEGKAAGFGLRNFWAGSLYKALKDIKI